MATKLYFHRTSGLPSGTLPSTEQSTLTSANDFEANQATNRSMNKTIGTGQTSLANASTNTTNLTNYYCARWVSPKLNQTSISANTWDYHFAAAESNNNANFPCSGNNQPIYVNMYVWRTSNGTKVGTILDGNTNSDFSEAAGTSEDTKIGTFVGSGVSGITVDDDVIVFEMWFRITQQMATSYTQTVYFDGTVEDSITDNAAYIGTPETISFVGDFTLFERTCNQTISISDSATKSALKLRSTNDTISVTDALGRIKTSVIGIPQTISFSDSVTRLKTAIRDINQTISLTDSLDKVATKFINIADTIGLTDSINKIKTAIISIPQTISLTDSLDKVATKIRLINQTISFSDAVAAILIGGGQLFERAINETISVVDSLDKVALKLRSISQVVTLTDSLEKVALKLRLISQTISLTDSLEKAALKLINISQVVTLTDAVVKSALKIRSITDNISVVDALNKSAIKIRNISDSIGLTDVVQRLKIPFNVGQLFEIAINETISLSDSVNTIIKRVRDRLVDSVGNGIKFSIKDIKQKETWKTDYLGQFYKKMAKKYKSYKKDYT